VKSIAATIWIRLWAKREDDDDVRFLGCVCSADAQQE
jgi:hypothetical protein